MTKPKNDKLNFDTLAGVTIEANSDTEAARQKLKEAHDLEFELCANNFWYFSKFLVTYDEENEKKRAFPQFPYLISANASFDTNQKNIVCKSRRLLITWLCVARQLHRSKFAGTPVGPQVYKGAVMTIGELEAVELIDRVVFLHEELPQWMQARNPMVVRNNLFVKFEGGGSVRGFPLKREGPRTFGFTEVLFDEMAYQEAVRSVYTGLAPTLGAKGKLIAVSTPNGKGNLFADIWLNKNEKYNDINRIKIEWHENPEHDENWYKALSSSMDDRMVARELGLSFATPEGDPVWPEFNKQVHVVDDTPIVPGRPMYIGWDLGFHYPAIVFMQRNNRDQWQIIAELQEYDMDFPRFNELGIEIANSLYNRIRVPEIHVTPPDGRLPYRAKAHTGAQNDIQQIKLSWSLGGTPPQVKIGPGKVGTRDNEGSRLKSVRKLWRLRKDGEPGILINKRCEILIEGCQAGYCYPMKGGEEPDKNNEYTHTQDAMQQPIAFYDVSALTPPDHTKPQRRRPRIGSGTGL